MVNFLQLLYDGVKVTAYCRTQGTVAKTKRIKEIKENCCGKIWWKNETAEQRTVRDRRILGELIRIYENKSQKEKENQLTQAQNPMKRDKRKKIRCNSTFFWNHLKKYITPT